MRTRRGLVRVRRIQSDPSPSIAQSPSHNPSPRSARAPCVRVIQPARKAERLKARVGVGEDLAEGVVVEALDHLTGSGVDDETHAAQVVRDDAIGDPALDQVGRDIRLLAVDEPRHHVARTVELGDGVELVLVVEPKTCAGRPGGVIEVTFPAGS